MKYVCTEELVAKVLLTSRFLGHREQNGRKMLLTSQFLGHRERKKCSKREIYPPAAMASMKICECLAPPPRDNGARRLRSGGLRRARAQRPGLPAGRCPVQGEKNITALELPVPERREAMDTVCCLAQVCKNMWYLRRFSAQNADLRRRYPREKHTCAGRSLLLRFA